MNQIGRHVTVRDIETTNEMYVFQTTPLSGHAPYSGSRVHPVGGVAKQDQVQRGKRGAKRHPGYFN